MSENTLIHLPIISSQVLKGFKDKSASTSVLESLKDIKVNGE